MFWALTLSAHLIHERPPPQLPPRPACLEQASTERISSHYPSSALAILKSHRISFLQAVNPSRYSIITCQLYSLVRFSTQIVSIQFISIMGKRPHVRPEAGERESRHVQLLPCSQPYPFFHILHSYESILTQIVSSDTVVAIAFGLISIFISLLGVWISYLTLRATSLGYSTDLNFLRSPLAFTSLLNAHAFSSLDPTTNN
jgi:hypothetical protein